MEANNAAFQSTPHKCDMPVDGSYHSCDRGGCAQNTRVTPQAFGPGPDFTINTVLPFEVRAEFPAEDGILTGMRTNLEQGGRRIVLDHARCGSEYLAHLSDALADGMSLRITYWGDKAKTMAWMDAPPCMWQTCSGSSARDAFISNITVEELPLQKDTPMLGALRDGAPSGWVVSDPKDKYYGQAVPADIVKDSTRFAEMEHHAFVYWRGSLRRVERQRTGASLEELSEKAVETPEAQDQDRRPMVWVVSDPEDDLFEQVLPEEIAKDSNRLISMAGHHLARWQNSMHMVEQVERPDGLLNCGGHGEAPCKIRMNKDVSSWAEMIVGRSEERSDSSTTTKWLPGATMGLPLLSAMAVLFIVLAGVLRRRLWHPERHQEFIRAPSGAASSTGFAGSPMRYSRLEAGNMSPPPRSALNESFQESSPLGVVDDSLEISPRKRPAASRMQRNRSM